MKNGKILWGQRKLINESGLINVLYIPVVLYPPLTLDVSYYVDLIRDRLSEKIKDTCGAIGYEVRITKGELREVLLNTRENICQAIVVFRLLYHN